MRRLDAAMTELRSLSDRDAILDCFFEHSKGLFRFVVLFVVRGDSAHGRRVHGLGAPEGLVARLSFPLNQPGILGQARDIRKPFVATPSAAGADAILLGNLGRAMPSALVAPVVVRERIVAILLGEGATEALAQGAQASGRSPMEHAKEEMLLWTAAVGDAFERLIVRKKSGDTGIALLQEVEARRPPSVPPPRMPQAPAPAVKKTERRSPIVLVSAIAGFAILAAGAFLGLSYTRSEQGPEAIAVAPAKLTGWPRVEPSALLEQAKRVAGASSELVMIQTDTDKTGMADFGPNKSASALTFTFATPDEEAEVRVDAAGMHAPRKQARARCGDRPCLSTVPPPRCTFAQIAEAVGSVGNIDKDRATFTYAAGGGTDGSNAPVWLVSVAARGTVRLDPTTCKPLARERMRPPAVALSGIVDAPRVDPLKLLPLARTQSGLESDAVLLEIDARGVRTDGLVDLSAPDSNITYAFSDPDTVPASRRRWRRVTVGPEGMPIVSADSDREPLPIRFRGALSAPRCSFARIWKVAGNVPRDVTAHITYGRDGTYVDMAYWSLEVLSMGIRQGVSDHICVEWEKGGGDKPDKPAAK